MGFGRAVTGAAPRLYACTLNNQPPVAGPYAPAPPGISFSSAGAVVVRDVNCSLLSCAMDPPSHWSATTRIPGPSPVTPAVEILWRSGVNWRITRIELWIGLWVKKFLPELAGKSCQARRRGDKK